MELSDIFPYQKDPSYSFAPPGAVTEFEAFTSCSYLDMLQHVSGADLETDCHEGSLDETNLASWLEKDVSQPSPVNENGNGKGSETAGPTSRRFLGGLRLMIGVCNFSHPESRRTIPFTQESFKLVEQHLGMPEEFKYSLIGTTSRAFKFSCPKNSGTSHFKPTNCFVFRFGVFRPSYYQLALSHDPLTNITHGLLLSKTTHHGFPLLIQTLKQHQIHCTHPLLTAALLSKIVITAVANRVQAVDRILNELEETAGQHEYINIPLRNPLEMDFMTATRRLNFVGRTLGVERMRAEAMILALGVMGKDIAGFGKLISTSTSDDENGRATHEDATRMVGELITCHVDECQNLALRAEYEEKRTQTQLAVVYQFMTQKEAIVNSKIAYTSAMIATESKKDSSAMKAIAVLTMIFLPGTFIATIFAMPLFNWDNNAHPLFNDNFKYYWAIAIPLTLFVLFLWGLSVWLPWKVWLVGWMPKRLVTEHAEAGLEKRD
ncbi:hypothetical protein LOCC1_G004859 [Lachnellula occidentalis]|uniref:Uncharacterized protein n=1 Tax=Lachnellula occidentalis TaxID=215460 RepID=A0A8H8UH13_9HELO|nr:hypothetical protein LOCC1_G004859 [Lachnellula occidentalis]